MAHLHFCIIMGKIGYADFPHFCIFVRNRVSVPAGMVNFSPKYETITGFYEAEIPVNVSINQHQDNIWFLDNIFKLITTNSTRPKKAYLVVSIIS